MSDPQFVPARYRRHWLEYVATAAALAISGISLWVAIGTEDANRKMVAAASWPFLQSDSSDGEAGHDVITLAFTNAGVGPARVETFEVLWKGRALRSSRELITRCCGAAHRPPLVNGHWQAGTIGGTVIRAGETRAFITYPRTPENAASWSALDAVRLHELTFRVCYCSVFAECWINDRDDLNPRPVDRCPVPDVPYTN